MPVNHPYFGTFCCICFSGLDVNTCAVDENGTKWDVCKGDCATEAGIKEKGMLNFICLACKNKHHNKCVGGTYCDCQHREGDTVNKDKTSL